MAARQIETWWMLHSPQTKMAAQQSQLGEEQTQPPTCPSTICDEEAFDLCTFCPLSGLSGHLNKWFFIVVGPPLNLIKVP